MMRRQWFSVVFGLAVLLCGIQLSHAGSSFGVDESDIKISLDQRETSVSLALRNGTGKNFTARVQLELLDPASKVRASAALDVAVKRGASSVNVPLAFPYDKLVESERKEFPWYRLRYTVTPQNSGAAVTADTVAGVVSISEVTPDLFELRVNASSDASSGSLYRARVRTANPVTQHPVKNIPIVAELKFDTADDKKISIKASGATDEEGFATLDFKLPPDAVPGDSDASLKVTAERGFLTQKAETEVKFNKEPRLLLTTDKPLYQPGQMLHARSLVFDATHHAIADTSATLRLEDPDGTVVYRTTLKTSRFGVASADWQIPDNIKLGDYWLKFELADEKYSDETNETDQRIKISRYDLPNFSVTTKTDHPFYLGGQNAEVEVHGDYLFGQPVKKARVRVVRETERTWNYKEQKYETTESEPLTGETDASGLFIAHLDLADEHKKLKDEDYARFRDLDFAAYVTDPTTNRTEQRRFSVRLTKDPIHVYINEGRYRQAEGLPLAFYVSTSYADGTPAQCEVSVTRKGATVSMTRTKEQTVELVEPDRTILKVKTNRYGVAKVSGPVVHLSEEEGNNISLRLVARDREGQMGHGEEEFWLSGERTEIRVETDKSLYGAGEPIVAEISSNKQKLNLFVDVSSDGRVISSQLVRLEGGRASLTLPYSDEFKGRLTISATSTEIPENRYYDYVGGTRTVVYPRNRELNLDVRFAQTTYRPGEDASADVSVRAPDGGKVESALGVVVFDKAVEERARTEQEFSSNFGFGGSFYYLWYGAGDIGGITPRDIEQLDITKPHPDELELVAELLFNNDRYGYEPNIFGGTKYESDQRAVFEKLLNDEVKPLRATLAVRYDERREYPTDDESLRRITSDDGLDFNAQRDPWGEPFRAEFSIVRELDTLVLYSNGPDKKAKTGDDITVAVLSWPYFLPVGERINKAVADYHARTGGHIRNAAVLKDELARRGFNLDDLRDRWGQPYALDFGISETNYTIAIKSGGPNKTFETDATRSSDDFTIWTTLDDYFAESRAAIDPALNAYLNKTGNFPQTDAELRDALRRAGLKLDDMRDGWGNQLYATFSMETRYGDHITLESRGNYDPNATQQHTVIRPVNQTVYHINLRSAGADGKVGTPDDFDAATYSTLVSEQSAKDATSKTVPTIVFSGGMGAIAGTVTDPSGAVIPGVAIKATQNSDLLVFTTTSDEEGQYIFRNLPSGVYRLEFTANSFKNLILTDVQVQSSNLITTEVRMEVGGVAETVSVIAGGAEMVSRDSAQLSVSGSRSKTNNFSIDGVDNNDKKSGAHATGSSLSTPRLREDFPETLLWQPEVITDKAGRAQVRFKLADNITTWKMSVIASTENGELATVEKEVRAFQPFFAELDPPRVLTEGDRISLPVVLRNYLDKMQAVDFEIKPENWFALTGPAHQHAEVPAGDSARQTFDIRVVASIKDGKSRITAYGADASDAIEKPVTVHPDGEEKSQTAAQIFKDTTTLDINVPADVINHTTRSELKIYPNLSAHLLESVEGILQRPYGCGEQTISSTYPSVLVLKLYDGRTGKTASEPTPPAVVARARRYAQLGYERLLNYRAEGGGFTYWGRGEPDLALTAYALRFLTDARTVVAIDEDIITETRAWLSKQQREDGSWPAYDWGHKEDRRRTALVTAFIARVLAASASDAKADVQTDAKPAVTPDKPNADAKTQTPLQRALRFLSARIEEIDEPYLIASYALAASDAGEMEAASHAVAKLQTLALDKGAASYWNLETNTPFYGWGTAGRVETTALVVQALARDTAQANAKTPQANQPSAQRNKDELISRGLLFLIRNKDRYGVWLSTQATVNVLDTLIRLFKQDTRASLQTTSSGDASSVAQSNTTNAATVFVNGRPAGELSLPSRGELAAPVTLDLSPFVAAGVNHVEIRRPDSSTQAQAQTVTSYYVPWSKSDAASSTQNQTQPNANSALRLAVNFDRASAETTQEINCHVEAERIGHRGYGMLLAEVGLPPGADVDRASLERTMKESGWSISRYDVLPDRLVFYLWPEGGGTKFDFKFRPRFGLDAQTAPSQLYDYYNPEARTVLAPTRFVIR